MMEKWKLGWRIHLLTVILIMDGLLLGGTAGFMHTKETSRAVQSQAVQGQAVQNRTVQNENVPEQTAQSRAEQPVVALTFDDGPHAVCTPQLLDGLKERGIHATFFLMGENIAGKEDLVRRMQQEGHLIGNHSYRHVQLTKAGEEAVCQSIEKTQQIIAGITGEIPLYLRPPYGDWNEQLECRLELTPVFWTVDSLDWKLRNTQAIVKRVAGTVKNGDIILLHDIFPTSVEAALELADLLRSQGYAFVTVDELLID
jgi:peptidoglycan/xylan/chitin deacetylase (PgdA/CDA1 family)